MAKPTPARSLDAFDLAILRILQTDARTPQRAIGEAVNLSAAAVQRRIAAMEASGVITAITVMVDLEAVGLGITAMVEVHLEDERTESIRQAKALFLAEPEVQQCYYSTGGISFFVIIVTTDMAAYQALAKRLFEDNPGINRFRTLIALDRVKTGGALAI